MESAVIYVNAALGRVCTGELAELYVCNTVLTSVARA